MVVPKMLEPGTAKITVMTFKAPRPFPNPNLKSRFHLNSA